MRIIAKRTLRQFWEDHPRGAEAKTPPQVWHSVVEEADYEARHWVIDPPSPIEAIRIRMEQKNLRQSDLVPMIGSRGRVSEVLSRKRALTLPMIRRLSEGLGLRADVLIQETRPSHRQPRARSGRPSASACWAARQKWNHS